MNDLVRILVRGGIAVIPTDTCYGIVASVAFPDAIERVYDLRQRERTKPVIVLLSSLDDLALFSVTVSESLRAFLEKIWPGAVSVILPVEHERSPSIHRGTDAIAFRVPHDAFLQQLLVKTGPLIAPSANLAGQPPATTVAMAREYFGEGVEWYVDAGVQPSISSTLIRYTEGEITPMRDGVVVPFDRVSQCWKMIRQ